ncbi:MAG TPA: exopolysaccharide biosynthesis protein [Verrucomicrobiae bacterium]|nr:exopolysaccharide biosynthesis protein [Verrucomicrobiae bacterium]
MERRSSKSRPFSRDLEHWLKGDGDKTMAGLNRLFGEKTFAIAWLILMALPALPLPTGGITHITEIITMLLCLELIIGRRSIWLPRRWQGLNVGKLLSGKAGSKFIGFIVWFERLSRQRWSSLLARQAVLSVVGVLVLGFTVAAFVAPPFSWLDTLPSLGVVVIALALILEDGLILLGGIIVGILGIGLEVAVGAALYDGIRHLF